MNRIEIAGDIRPGCSLRIGFAAGHGRLAVLSAAGRLANLDVAGTAPVTISGVALAGHIAFDCGELLSGTLFADPVLHGELRKRGDTVSRDDLGLPPRPRSD